MKQENEILAGYAGQVLRIDLTGKQVRKEPLDPSLCRNYLGGRGLNVARLMEELPQGTDGLDPENPLIFGVGPLNGTFFPGAGRFNVTAKSPQTGILGDSNAGGFLGSEIKFAGYDQIILTGKCAHPVYIYIENETVILEDASDIWGLDVWQTHKVLRQRHGARAQVACVGPAAERGVKFAGIFCNLVRAAARTGMGTVMASKNVKALVVRGTRPVRVANPPAFQKLVEALDKRILAHAEYRPRARLGTTRLLSALNEAGCLATRHFQTGRFEHAAAVSGERLADTIKIKSKACQSCTIPCSRFFHIREGKYAGLKSEGPEFEGLAGFSSRVGVGSLAASLKGVDLCNRYGMDVITTSECISFAMELYQRGLLSREEVDGLDLTWGNEEAVLELVHKIARREGFGDVLADGVKVAAERIGRGSERYAMHVKGLEVFQADPRGLKAYALGYAVASRGGDHLRSEPSFEFCEDPEEGRRRFGAPESAFRLEYKGKGKVVKYYEEVSALADCLNACKNTVVNMEIVGFAEAAALLEAAIGWDLTAEDIQQACERIVNLERVFIVGEGIRRADDTLPRRFLEEPLPPDSGSSAGSVVELEPMLDEYYTARGWDVATGIPRRETLQRLGLQHLEEYLRKRNVILP